MAEALPIELSYRVNENEYVEGFVHSRKRIYGHRAHVVGIATTFVGLLLLWLQVRDIQSGRGFLWTDSVWFMVLNVGLPGILIGYGLSMLGGIWSLSAVARKRFRERVREMPTALKADDTGVEVITEGVRAHLDWSAIVDVEETPYTIQLYWERFDYILIPKTAFNPPEAAKDFLEACYAKCPQCPEDRLHGFPVVQPRNA